MQAFFSQSLILSTNNPTIDGQSFSFLFICLLHLNVRLKVAVCIIQVHASWRDVRYRSGEIVQASAKTSIHVVAHLHNELRRGLDQILGNAFFGVTVVIKQSIAVRIWKMDGEA